MNWRSKVIFLSIVLLFSGFAFYYMKLYVVPKRHGIILFIVPGANPELLALTEYLQQNHHFKILSSPDEASMVQNEQTDNFRQDYTALMTRLFTGLKTDFSNLEKQKVDTLVYQAQRAGRAVGIISTTTFASQGLVPAYATASKGLSELDFMEKLVFKTRPNIIFSGGGYILEKYKNQKNEDMFEKAKKKGYEVIRTVHDLDNLQTWIPGPVFGVFRKFDFPFQAYHDIQEERLTPSLSAMTRTAIKKLQYNLSGYFLVIEHGLIRKSFHNYPREVCLEEIAALDSAIAEAKAYAGENSIIMVYCPFSIQKSLSVTFTPPESLATVQREQPIPGPGWFFIYGGRDELKGLLTPTEIYRYINQNL
jgi:alkaline phosphatase